MACDLPVRQCLEWHVLPRLRDARPTTDGNGYRALCPAHDDGEHSFGIAIADSAKKRFVYNCFACKNNIKVRRGLIGDDIPPGCLPLSGGEKEDLLDRLYRIATADTKDHGSVRFAIVAALEGYEDLPARAEVDRVAELSRTHRATGYRARKLALPGTSTANTRSYTLRNEQVKSPSSEATIDPPEAVA